MRARRSKQVAIRYVPAGQEDYFPAFLAGPKEVVNPLKEATDRFWQFGFEGVRRDGFRRFFVWQIPGNRYQAKQVRQMLIEKAVELGIVCIWIYSVRKPCTPEMLEYIKTLNETKPWVAGVA